MQQRTKTDTRRRSKYQWPGNKERQKVNHKSNNVNVFNGFVLKYLATKIWLITKVILHIGRNLLQDINRLLIQQTNRKMDYEKQPNKRPAIENTNASRSKRTNTNQFPINVNRSVFTSNVQKYLCLESYTLYLRQTNTRTDKRTHKQTNAYRWRFKLMSHFFLCYRIWIESQH